jgi:hypothetical protein
VRLKMTGGEIAEWFTAHAWKMTFGAHPDSSDLIPTNVYRGFMNSVFCRIITNSLKNRPRVSNGSIGFVPERLNLPPTLSNATQAFGFCLLRE